MTRLLAVQTGFSSLRSVEDIETTIEYEEALARFPSVHFDP